MSALSNLFALAAVCFTTNSTNLPTAPRNSIQLPQSPIPFEEKEHRNIILEDTAYASVSIKKITRCTITVSCHLVFESGEFPDDLFQFLTKAGFREEWSNPFTYKPTSADAIHCVVSFSRQRARLFTALYMPHGALKEKQLFTFKDKDLQVLYDPSRQMIESVTLKGFPIITPSSSPPPKHLFSAQIKGVCEASTPDMRLWLKVRPKELAPPTRAQHDPQHVITITKPKQDNKPVLDYSITCYHPQTQSTNKLIDECVRAITSPDKNLVMSGLSSVGHYEDAFSVTTILQPTELLLGLQP
jgi:hypothetical protein